MMSLKPAALQRLPGDLIISQEDSVKNLPTFSIVDERYQYDSI